MKNILPRDENVWLLVAESVRAESGGKMSLFGFLGTEKMQISADTILPTGIMMTFVFLLREGVGSFVATFEIRDPNGDTVHSKSLATAVKPSTSENHGIAVTMDPFLVTSLGVYRLSLTLDGKRYKRTFTVGPDIAVVRTHH